MSLKLINFKARVYNNIQNFQIPKIEANIAGLWYD